jgi:hypothetical protein
MRLRVIGPQTARATEKAPLGARWREDLPPLRPQDAGEGWGGGNREGSPHPCLWLPHHLKVSVRRNKPRCGMLSPQAGEGDSIAGHGSMQPSRFLCASAPLRFICRLQE